MAIRLHTEKSLQHSIEAIGGIEVCAVHFGAPLRSVQIDFRRLGWIGQGINLKYFTIPNTNAKAIVLINSLSLSGIGLVGLGIIIFQIKF